MFHFAVTAINNSLPSAKTVTLAFFPSPQKQQTGKNRFLSTFPSQPLRPVSMICIALAAENHRMQGTNVWDDCYR